MNDRNNGFSFPGFGLKRNSDYTLCALLVGGGGFKGLQMVQPLWKTVWQLLKKLNLALPDDPVIALLDGDPKAGTQPGICTPVFAAA